MRPYRSVHETGRCRVSAGFCRLLYGMSFSLAAEQFQRKSKRRAWLAIDVRCFARVVWEIGLQDAAAGGPHVLFLHPWLARASSDNSTRASGQRVESTISRWIEGQGQLAWDH